MGARHAAVPSAGGRAHAVALAVVTIAVSVALVTGLVVFVVLDDGWTRVIWAVIGGFLLWQLVPRPARPGPRAVPVPTDDGAVALTLRPFEIVTLRIARS